MSLATLYYARSTHKNQTHFYILYEREETEVENTVTFIIITKKTKYLGIHLKNHVLDLYAKNVKVLVQDTKEDLNKWKDMLCSWTGRFNMVMMSISPKLIQSFNSIPIKILTSFFL